MHFVVIHNIQVCCTSKSGTSKDFENLKFMQRERESTYWQRLQKSLRNKLAQQVEGCST